MYFTSRAQAGELLADRVAAKYSGKQCAVIGLSDGSVVVGAHVALRLHAPLCMLIVSPIELPREDAPIGGIAEDGSFAYNGTYSAGELEELTTEFRGFLAEEKGNRLSEMHRLWGSGGLIRKELLRDKYIILVSDGLNSGFSLDVAIEFLKPVRFKSLVVATTLASVVAVDRMHVVADDIICLNVVENYITTDHYYDAKDVPPHETIVKSVEQIMKHWK
jgi:predicted phosphoribosyltransferase